MSERVERARDLIAETTPDLLLLAGDLAGYDEEGAALDALRSPVPVLGVGGNMDGPRLAAELVRRGWLLDDEPRSVGGFTFGSPAVRGPCDVLVSHFPPKGTVDATSSGDHLGSTHVRERMRALTPRVLVCGHVHESPGVERAGTTLVVNCSMGAGLARGALILLSADAVSAELL
ncbi:MAG: metallophosphoesterase family protein [Deltaproteobacteria bacterium]|nr:metallophosphoesterase family protein [Deltaproteobacteria bacterium]